MKRKILTVCILCAVLLWGCGTPAAEPETFPVPSESETAPALQLDALCDGKTLKVLAIGNSFSNDTTQYLYDIAAAQGITDITLGRLFIASCSLQMHAENAAADAPKYSYYKNEIGIWGETANVTLLTALQDEDWDIITMQQNSGNSGQPATYDVYLGQLIDYVNQNKTNPNAKLVWHMTWAYQSDSTHKAFPVYANRQDVMYQAIISATEQKILTNDAFSAVIPVGTAIQNARTSTLGDTLTTDGYHLKKMGKLIGAYTWYAVFTGQTLDSIALTSLTDGTVLTESDKQIIMESVNNALRSPYTVTVAG